MVKKRFIAERDSTAGFIYPPDQIVVHEKGVALLRPHIFGASQEALNYEDIVCAKTYQHTKNWYVLHVETKKGRLTDLVLNGLTAEDAEEAARIINKKIKEISGQ